MKEPLWIDERDALILHERLLSLHGGAPGMRDPGLLASALARPRQHLVYAGTADIVNLCAIYTAGILQNHPFIDGNKRTGFIVGILFLELNDYRFTATEKDAAEIILAMAAGHIDESGYAAFLRDNISVEGPAEG